MKGLRTLRRAVVLSMAVLVPVLTAEVLTGQQLHEWLGTAMLALGLVHLGLNMGWWKGLLRGTYTPFRALVTAVDLMLTLDMAALGVSGLRMSAYVVPSLPFHGGMVLARNVHLLTSWWGLVLLSVHVGLHMDRAVSALRTRLVPQEGSGGVRLLAARVLAAALALWGAYAFFALHLPEYLLLRTHFMLYDGTRAPALFLTGIGGIMWLFGTAGWILGRLARSISAGRSGIWRGVALLVPVLAVCFGAALLQVPVP